MKNASDLEYSLHIASNIFNCLEAAHMPDRKMLDPNPARRYRKDDQRLLNLQLASNRFQINMG